MRARGGLSMPEVLVVIGVIVLLLALLFPSLGLARERLRRLVCANNLRQWGVAWQFYQDDNDGYLPQEGNHFPSGIKMPYAWYNALPPYLDMPSYVDLPRVSGMIEERPDIHIWICPSKNLTDAYKSGSGMNQFHYGMNQVLDGLGEPPGGSSDAPGFPDIGGPDQFVASQVFSKKPYTVLMFDIVWNSPAGTPRDVATQHQRDHDGRPLGKFHGDYANVLYIGGSVGNCETDDLVTNRDFRHGDVIWTRPTLYWGYPPPGWK